MKKFSLILLLTISISCRNHTEHLKYGTPSTNGTILNREGYILLHDNLKKVPLWVSYHLTKRHLQGTQERVDRFKPDSNLKEGERAELSDYKGSGYDRGHMAPAGDMKRSYKVMVESFYLSNMCPQTAGLNRGLWKTLEERDEVVCRVGGFTIRQEFKIIKGKTYGGYLFTYQWKNGKRKRIYLGKVKGGKIEKEK